MLRIVKFLKDFLLFSRLSYLFMPFRHLFLFLANFTSLTAWVQKNKRQLIINDFYAPQRDYNRRAQLYKAVSDHYGLSATNLTYLEFGVASGVSFKWWLAENKNAQSSFWGFDTFEGLPESWSIFYDKGAMAAPLPDFKDDRALFLKGIFQDTLHGFIESNKELLKEDRRKLIHMDADLFSSTIFVLSQLYPYLRKGDLILFDEFNVATHEYQAYTIFTEAFYVKLKPVAAQNNFYQVAFEVI